MRVLHFSIRFKNFFNLFWQMVSLKVSFVCMVSIAGDQSQDMVSPLSVDALRFRPNIVVSGADAHDEDNWQSIDICSQKFGVRPSQPLLPLIYVSIDQLL